MASQKIENLISKVRKDIQPNGNPYSYFNRFQVPSGNTFNSNVGYVFFTKPNLNFSVENINKMNYFSILDSSESFGRYILSSLSTSYNKKITNSNFIPILSNSVQNFETKDTSLNTDTDFQDYIGHKIVMPRTIIDSLTSDTITLNFIEHEDLRVTHIMKVWIEYINAIRRGIISPTTLYRKHKILDFTSSIYFFLCGQDGHSIKYYTKLTGIYPVNIPYSTFSWETGQHSTDSKKISVTFQYHIKEDLQPEIINDFMKITDKNYFASNGSASNFNTLNDTLADNWAKSPCITKNGLYFTGSNK